MEVSTRWMVGGEGGAGLIVSHDAPDEMVMGTNLMSASYGLRHLTDMSASRSTAGRSARDQRQCGQCSCHPTADAGVSLVYEDLNSEVLSAEDVVRVKSALDSGACRNCLGPDGLPAGVEPSGNPSGASFVGPTTRPSSGTARQPPIAATPRAASARPGR